MKKSSTKPAKDAKPGMIGLFDVAQRLGISVPTARQYALKGKLPFVRIGGRIRVPTEAVEKAQREGI